MKHRIHGITARLRRFIQGYGFALLSAICIGVITATALWTRQSEGNMPTITPPAYAVQPAGVSLQEALRSAATPTPLPTIQPALWQTPLDQYTVIQGYSPDVMVQSGSISLWSLHLGTDLQAEAGTPVVAMADGKVLACGEGTLDGTWIALSHSNGYISRYCSLALLGAYREGDSVRAGQTIGFVGNTSIGERDLGPHLHLEILHDGQSVDPLDLIR